jgi:hypothetical protein
MDLWENGDEHTRVSPLPLPSSTRSVRRPGGFVLDGHSSTTFLRNIDSAPNLEYEKVMEGCAVIQDLGASYTK